MFLFGRFQGKIPERDALLLIQNGTLGPRELVSHQLPNDIVLKSNKCAIYLSQESDLLFYQDLESNWIRIARVDKLSLNFILNSHNWNNVIKKRGDGGIPGNEYLLNLDCLQSEHPESGSPKLEDFQFIETRSLK